MNELEKTVEKRNSGKKPPEYALANIAEFLRWRQEENERRSQEPLSLDGWRQEIDEMALVVTAESNPQLRTPVDLLSLVQSQWDSQTVLWDWYMRDATLQGGRALGVLRSWIDAALDHWEGVQIGICELVMPRLIVAGIAEIAASNPVYLRLPKQLACIEQEAMYHTACHYGRLWYHSEQYSTNEETCESVRVPRFYCRQEVFDFIDGTIRIPGDVKLCALLPLPYRVGVVVGWLSALAVAQREDAGAGMVMLAALVAPLLLCSKKAGQSGQVKSLKAAKS